MNSRYRVFWASCLMAAGVALTAAAAAQVPSAAHPLLNPPSTSTSTAGPRFFPICSSAMLSPAMSAIFVTDELDEHKACVRQWGATAPDGTEPDIALFDRKVGRMRCHFFAHVSPESALTAAELDELERDLRRDTYKRIEEMMRERRADFESATLSCATLAHLDDERWRAERRERLVDRALEQQQQRREQ